MANPNRRRGGPMYLNCVFEACEQLTDSGTRAYGYHTTATGISCSGTHGNKLLEYDAHLIGYSSPSQALQTGRMYSTRATFIPSADGKPPQLFHDPSNAIDVGDANTFAGNLVDNAAVTSVGTVISRRILDEPRFEGKPVMTAIMRHSAYDPIVKAVIENDAEVRCEPVRNLERCQNLFQVGRELTVVSVVVDWDTERRLWILRVIAVSVNGGHETPANLQNASLVTTTNGAGRIPRFQGNATAVPGLAQTPTASTSAASHHSHTPAPSFESFSGLLGEDHEAHDDNLAERPAKKTKKNPVK